MSKEPCGDMQGAMDARYSDAPRASSDLDTGLLNSMMARGSCRAFQNKDVPTVMIDMLCAAAFASPTKSDLQQRDMILLRSKEKRAALAGLVSGQGWIAEAPMIAVFCGNNRRQRLLHDWRGIPFANDHLDAFFNAVGDAAVALGAFVTAAEALGLGCCPISGVRNRPAEMSDLLGLPKHVFPFAGLAFGFPLHAPEISPRLPLRVTCHVDQYQETDLEETVCAYDAHRAEVQPYRTQRAVEKFGQSDAYCWSEDKVRQYAHSERADFGDYIRAQGFRLE